ncbi:MAG: Chaperone protein ClpB 1 [Chloroflexi bacterium ADurb.Bin360]|nr:MAG: Chaperone protein ClpB 1 [Chloroflexi bacterium ADurb.Bin360]
MKDPRRPIGTFLFLGASGVGKTETAKALAAFLFDDEEALLRVDMSEYREAHTVSRLFGAPPGYVGYDQGGQLTEAVRRRPYQVVLFDEIEKAHSDVWNALLQILDDGRLTDGQGHIVDFRHTVVIMTSNVGTEMLRRGGALGFAHSGAAEEDDARQRVLAALRQTFRPEFINRVDEIIVFGQLTVEDMEQIVRLQMHEVDARLQEYGLRVNLLPAALRWLAQQGYDPQYGARPLRRAIQRYIESPLSIRILSGDFSLETLIDIDLEGEELVFHSHAAPSADAASQDAASQDVASQDVASQDGAAPLSGAPVAVTTGS